MSALSGLSNRAIGKILPNKIDHNELSKFDFIVGDRVFIASNPDRVGTAVFNGTTKFSDGIWIGVALDEPFGKNNGIVQGVKYFQCDDNHGIFVRPNNLRHASDKELGLQNCIEHSSKSTEDQLNNSNLQTEPDEFNVNDSSFATNTVTKLTLGDRVYVVGKSNGSMHKNGILRFLGPTKFAEGTWVGIELDNPVGKNDGSVNGVRYFSCKSHYGLFALEDKVHKLDLSGSKCYGKGESGVKNGSTESLSSVASNFSSASRTRARMGMNVVNATKKYKGATENAGDVSKSYKTNAKDSRTGDKTSSAIQNVLKEKEQHVEQLLREREIERIDLATTTAKLEEMEKYHNRNTSTFNDQKLFYDKKFNELQNTIYLISQERDQLLERLEEEKKKVEDLLFRIEEKEIDGSDLENKTEENESQIFELNEKLALEREMREQLEKKLNNAANSGDSSAGENKYLNQIKTLEGKLLKLKLELNEERSDSKVKSLTKFLEEKEAVINDMQDRFEKAKCRLSETKKELDVARKYQNESLTENNSLRNDIKNLQFSIANMLKEKTKNNEALDINNQTKEFSDLQYNLGLLKAENKNLSTTLTTLNQEIEVEHRNSEERRLEINDLRQKCKQFEVEKLDHIKTRKSLAEENDKLVKQLTTYNQQLEKLRLQISDLYNDNKRLIESKSEFENIEKNIKLEIDNLRGQISFLETENSSLVKSLHELESDSSQNSCILQLTVKNEVLESSIQELNVALKSEKEQNKALITKNATLFSDLEHLRQKRDDEDNIMYDQLQSLKSINKLLETDKLTLSEAAESKTKELIIIRDRLLKVSQEYECLQETFTKSREKLEQEKRVLTDKVRKMEKQLDENDRKSQFSISESASDKRKSESKDQISSLKDAKENAEQQITFLNNVIVNTQNKYSSIQVENQKLKDRIKDLENGNILPTNKPKKVATPRLYCDICEVFDSHDTDKCTLIDNESPSPSPRENPTCPKAKTKAPRLYCDICEVFDSHDTFDCQDQQTF